MGTGGGTASGGGRVNASKTGMAVDRHPERRVKAAYAAYEDQHLASMRKENPGLRLQQVKDLVWKKFERAPENPFNQIVLEHDATREEERQAIEELRRQTEERLRID